MDKKKSIKINNIIYNETQINNAIEKTNKLVIEKKFNERLRKFISVIANNDLKFDLKIEECNKDSSTDGFRIQLSLSNEFLFYEDALKYVAFSALAMHETEHVLSSDFDAIKPFLNKCYRNLFEPIGLSKNISDSYSKYILNAIEDGRIERIAVNRSPGCFQTLKWMRYVSWYNSIFDDNDRENENLFKISIMLWAVCSYATIGLLPNEWEKYYNEDSEETKLINLCKNLIDKAVNSNYSSKCIDLSYEVVKILKDYLFKYSDNIDDDILQEILQSIMSSSDNHEESEESRENKDSNSNIDSNISIRMNKDGNENKDKDEDENSSNSTSNKPNKNSNQKNSNNSSKNGKNQSNQDSNQNGKIDSKSKKDENKTIYQKDMLNIDDVLNTINDIETNVRDIAEKQLSDKINSEPKQKENVEVFDTKTKKIEVDINKLNELGENIEKAFPFRIFYDNNLKNNIRLNSKLELDAKFLRNKLKPIFEAKKPVYKKNRLNGSLDVTKLTRIKTKEKELFKSKNDLKIPSVAISILIDGSGSMNGYKAEQALNVASIIENAVNGYTKLKIDVFNTGYGNYTNFNIIKDFNDEKCIGYCEKFRIRNNFFCNGNRDGLAIRLSSEALLKREEETKIMFVISDGIPSSYCTGYESGIEDVKSAVHLASKKGIKLFGIYIDSGDAKTKSEYNYMYGQRRSIMCSPNEIKTVLPRIMKKQMF